MSDLIIEQEFVAEFPIDQLRPHPENPRIHDDAAIDESIEVNKFQGAVLVQKSTNYLLDGHGRVNSLKRKGATTVPAFVLDIDDAAARSILLSRNKVGAESGYNEEALASLLSEMAEAGQLMGTGYQADDVDDLLAKLGAPIVTEPENFEGDYAGGQDEAKARAERKATTKSSMGLREVVLVYTDEDFDQMKRAVGVVSDFHSALSTSEAVLSGMVTYAKQLEADAQGPAGE